MPLDNQQNQQQQQQNGNDGSQGQETRDQNQQNSVTWPEGWRTAIAGGNAERAKGLERFADPSKLFESYTALQQRVSSGELRSNKPRPSGEGVTPEAVKAWKTERGLPGDVAEIKFPLPAGAKMEDLDEAGKARVGHFTQAFFDGDLTQAQVDLVMTRYNEFAEKEASDRAVADAQLRDELEDNLRAEWGGDYRSNLAITDRFMQKAFGEETADLLMGARTADGRRLFNVPEFFKALTQLARANGVDDVVTGDTNIGGKTVDQRIEEINNILRTDRGRYYAEGLDKEKQRLLERKGV